jgi:hypothetical protein
MAKTTMPLKECGMAAKPRTKPPVFISGLKLSERFFRQVVQPVLNDQWPRLRYSAGLVGWGSEVLGYDTPRSMDHMWGPRLLLFLSEAECRPHAQDITEHLRHTLPRTFGGFSVHFGAPDAIGVRQRESNSTGPVDHLVEVSSPEAFLRHYLGIPLAKRPRPVDWLSFSEQSLLEVTGGKMFHDGLRRMRALRARFAYYPRDVWLHKLAHAWQALTDEEAFPGRCHELDDTIGWRVLVARQVERVMRLCFLQKRVYMPYSKWFGTAFLRLRSARHLAPMLSVAMTARSWASAEEHLMRAYEYVARIQNRLKVTAPQPVKATFFFGRPYRVIWGDRFAEACCDAIRDAEVRSRTHIRRH